ncbi:M20/M25/M40 family metallo-hydrolase [Streptomyces sulphureus]|uniref:M20/M25/M40 family metallo-hydrolase n=1 Tax=Streptomyces sulphureus TaxID=47758 RepID=UPI00037A0B72|nr:M20/M25/M40 family metallo-hydrolase [Streptomyces sulphureus]
MAEVEAPSGAAARIDERALDEAVEFTAALIRCDTTNHGGGEGTEREAAEFVAARLEEVGLHARMLEKAPGRTNVVARIEGSEPGADALLVHGHLDVVPADAREWSVPPFSGEVRDGVLWGRGAIDMKNHVGMVLAVARAWARAGVRPRRDIVLAFTADEEDSAAYGSEFLAEEHSELFAGCTQGISESGAFTFHAGDGVRLYPLAAGERGTAWLRLTAQGRAGHGSKVNGENAVSKLAAAVHRIGEYDWPLRLTPVVRAGIRELALVRGVEPPAGLTDDADPDPTPAEIDEVLALLGPSAELVEPTLRNSANPTMLSAGYKVNVIPGTATALVDGRVVPGGEEEFLRTLDRLTGPDVEWEFEHREVPLAASAASAEFAAMSEALLHFDPGAHVVPYCMSGGTDAKQFSRLGIEGYGFTPLRLPEGFDYEALFHGVDERVPVEALHFGVRVMDRALLAM